MTLHLTTWFHGDRAGAEGRYASVGGDSASERHWQTYLDCAALLLATSAEHNSGVQHHLVTNLDREAMFGWWGSRTGVGSSLTIHYVENTHVVPPGFYSLWQNQFYVLDVLRVLVEATSPGDSILILDSDCLVRASLAELDELIQEHGCVVYGLDVGHGLLENGLSDDDLDRLTRAFLGRAPARAPRYCGGEILAVSHDYASRLLPIAESTFDWSLVQHQADLPHPNEEAHLLSMCYAHLGSPKDEGARFIRRIWTQPWRHSTVTPDLEGIPIWHLPAEKKTGLARLAASARHAVGRGHLPNLSARKINRVVGVPTYGLPKRINDFGRLVQWRLRSWR